MRQAQARVRTFPRLLLPLLVVVIVYALCYVGVDLSPAPRPETLVKAQLTRPETTRDVVERSLVEQVRRACACARSLRTRAAVQLQRAERRNARVVCMRRALTWLRTRRMTCCRR
jgi:hypothetical protein